VATLGRTRFKSTKFGGSTADKIGILTAIARRNQPQITAVNMEDEEDRDRDAINELMKRYTKLWRNIFIKYQSEGFALKKETNFDDIKKKK
jgi:hypothetical protein